MYQIGVGALLGSGYMNDEERGVPQSDPWQTGSCESATWPISCSVEIDQQYKKSVVGLGLFDVH